MKLNATPPRAMLPPSHPYHPPDRSGSPPKPWRRWYKLARWRRKRLTIFERDLFTCQMPRCRRVEGNTALLVCDHVKPHRGDERLFWDDQNLQTLCKPCHDGLKQAEEQTSLQQRGVWD